jgi:hypothetical protein
MGTRAVATSGVLIAFICGIGWPAGSQVPQPEVSPEGVVGRRTGPPAGGFSPLRCRTCRLPKGEDPFRFFDNYSWRQLYRAQLAARDRGSQSWPAGSYETIRRPAQAPRCPSSEFLGQGPA